MAQAIIVSNPRNIYSENILNDFNDGTLSVVSGKLNGTATYNSDVVYDSFGKSIKATIDVVGLNKEIRFNIDGFSKVIEKTGKYIIQFSVKKNNELDNADVAAYVYVNGILDTARTFIINIDDIGSDWTTLAQSFTLNAGEEIAIQFLLNADLNTTIVYFDAVKLEYDDRNLGIPSVYSLPSNYLKIFENITGFGNYGDSLATPTIVVGTSYTQITIDKSGSFTNENYLPKEIRGIGTLFNANKITPISAGDTYTGRIDLTVEAESGSPTFIEVIIDFGTGAAGLSKAFTGYVQTGGKIPYDQSINFNIETFVANGGRIFMRVDTGSVTIGKRNIFINRLSKHFV